jgi:hypothetical protein
MKVKDLKAKLNELDDELDVCCMSNCLKEDVDGNVPAFDIIQLDENHEYIKAQIHLLND